MANVRVVEDTQEDLQEAMAGGEKLCFEAFNIGSMKLNRNETKVSELDLAKKLPERRVSCPCFQRAPEKTLLMFVKSTL